MGADDFHYFLSLHAFYYSKIFIKIASIAKKNLEKIIENQILLF